MIAQGHNRCRPATRWRRAQAVRVRRHSLQPTAAEWALGEIAHRRQQAGAFGPLVVTLAGALCIGAALLLIGVR